MSLDSSSDVRWTCKLGQEMANAPERVREEEWEFVNTEPEMSEEATKLGETRVEKTKREYGKEK